MAHGDHFKRKENPALIQSHDMLGVLWRPGMADRQLGSPSRNRFCVTIMRQKSFLFDHDKLPSYSVSS